MKTILDKTTRDELFVRINTLNQNSASAWGKMNVYEMVKHCILWEEMISGEVKCKRSLIGRIVGQMVLKGMVKDEKPLTPKTPSAPELIVVESKRDISAEREKWISLIESNAIASYSHFVHPFFGKMTKEQVGVLDYKHIDHHLRQFGS